MQIADVGEFGLIERIHGLVEREGRRTGRTVLGIGDDAAVLRPPDGSDLVVTTDAFVEDVHFRWQTQDARTVGRRAAAAALSDLAAMGARPLGVVVAFAAPPELALGRALDLVRGLLDVAQACGSELVGGNVTKAAATQLALTALGAVGRGHALRRDTARPGDRVCVTGCLGRSALELARAEAGRGRIRHVPEPRLEAGVRLAAAPFAGACIDVSDGFEADLGHLLAASRVAASLDLERLPEPPGFAAACRRAGIDAEQAVRRGGEDYELIFTVRPEAPPAAELARRLGVAVTELGSCTASGARDRAEGAVGNGFRHF